MGRLTYRLNDQCDHPTDSIILKPYLRYEEPETRKKILNRLAAYEDTGLEPEEIKEHEEAKYNAGYYHGDEDRCRWIEKELGPIEHLRDLIRADQDGQLVVLPSKTVWELTMDAGPDCDMKCPVDAWDESLGCDLCSKAKQFAYERPCTQEMLKELGKTVFLTREEAEAALKGGEGWMTRERAAELLSEVMVLDDPEMAEAHRVAISALRQQETVTDRHQLNEPLTLDELVEFGVRSENGENIIVYCTPLNDWAKVFKFGLLFFGTEDYRSWPEIEADYSKTWLAYRQKPEEKHER